jgi:hypothetical protein
METIYKYQIVTADRFKVQTPRLVRWLCVHNQHDSPMIWAVVDTDGPAENHFLLVRGTGHPFTGEEGKYLGTFQMADGSLVFHVFAEKDD